MWYISDKFISFATHIIYIEYHEEISFFSLSTPHSMGGM